MATTTADKAVRNYLTALRDPSSLRDEKKIEAARTRLESASDELQRLKIRQEILELEQPPLDRYERDFVEHAKSWAEDQAISEQAFLEEGVPADVLRRAGMAVARGRRGRGAGRKRRVSSEEVRGAIPRGKEFTIKGLQERSGASMAVVRRIVQEEQDGGRLVVVGPDRSVTGPGRAPILYRAK